MSKPYTASSWSIHAWASGGISCYWMSGVIYSFLSLVFVLSYEMDPAKVGLAMMLPRLLDIVIDPLLGRLSDNLHTRWGRRRPFIFATTIMGTFLVMAVWWMPTSWADSWKGFTYLTCSTTLLYATLGGFQMAHGALGYELSDDYHQRSKVQALFSFYCGLGALGGGYTYWLAQRPFFGQGHAGEIHGFRILSVGMALLVLVFGLIPVFACRERFQNINRTHVNLGKALKATLRNRPFFIILLMRVINGFGLTLSAAIIPYVGIHSVCHGNMEAYNEVMGGWNGIVGVLLGLALIPAAAPITRWLGKRGGIIWCNGLAVVFAIITPFIMRPGHLYLWFAFTVLSMPAVLVLNNLLASVMPDICDIDELAHGERREGLFTAVMSFMTKLQASLCTGVGGILLAFSGFDQHLLQQPQVVIDKMRLYAFIPLIGGSVLTFIASYFFPLSKKMVDEVRAQLDARHASHLDQTLDHV